MFTIMGLYSNAESLVGRASDIRRNMLGPANPETLTSMHLLASVYNDESRQKDAEKLCRQTLQARRRVLGSSNRDTLDSANLLANILTQGVVIRMPKSCTARWRKRPNKRSDSRTN